MYNQSYRLQNFYHSLVCGEYANIIDVCKNYIFSWFTQLEMYRNIIYVENFDNYWQNKTLICYSPFKVEPIVCFHLKIFHIFSKSRNCRIWLIIVTWKKMHVTDVIRRTKNQLQPAFVDYAKIRRKWPLELNARKR